MATWDLDLYDLNAGSPRLSSSAFKSLMFNYQLDDPGAIEGELYISDPDTIKANFNPGQVEIKLKRNGTKVWAGYLWLTSINVTDYTVRFQGEGYASKFRNRVTTDDLIYHPENVHQIMWNLINNAQSKTNGDMGVTQGAHTGGSTSVNRDYCGTEFPNLADSLDELTTMDDGVDWLITPCISYGTDKVFRTFNPRRGTDLSGSVTLDQDNTQTLTYEIDATEVANDVWTIGTGDCTPPENEQTNGSSQTNYGLMQAVEDTDYTDSRDITAHGREYIRNHKTARWTASAIYEEVNGPSWGAFDVGDIITLASNRGYSNFSQGMRVTGIEVNLTPPDIVFLTITLDSVIS